MEWLAGRRCPAATCAIPDADTYAAALANPDADTERYGNGCAHANSIVNAHSAVQRIADANSDADAKSYGNSNPSADSVRFSGGHGRPGRLLFAIAGTSPASSGESARQYIELEEQMGCLFAQHMFDLPAWISPCFRA